MWLGATPGLYSPKALESKERRDWEADSGVGDFGKEIRRRRREEGDPDTRARSVSDGKTDTGARDTGPALGSAQDMKRGGRDGPSARKERGVESCCGGNKAGASEGENRPG
jgi:hypothetical protein